MGISKKLKKYIKKNKLEILFVNLTILICLLVWIYALYFLSLHNIDFIFNAANLGVNIFETKDYGISPFIPKYQRITISLVDNYLVSFRYITFIFPVASFLLHSLIFFTIRKMLEIKSLENGATRNCRSFCKKQK